MALKGRTCVAAIMVCQVMALQAAAEITTYTDESAYNIALAQHGYVPVHEGFEDDAVWGAVRSTIVGGQHTAPSVSNLGITWTSSSPNNAITTSPGAAASGQWGMYSLPHGDYANGITDGWRGTAAQPLVAIGGWVRTNTPFAALVVFLDGNEQNALDFDGDNVLGPGPYRFFGIIDTDGFSAFDFRETEGTIDDQKFIFGDDYTFAFGGVILDCNQNGMVDAFDIMNGASTDCNNNLIPDECEIDENCQAPGGPFFCTGNCDTDCNDNGILDSCEVVTAALYASGELSPIGFGAPQSFTIRSAPPSLGNVVMSFTAHANLGGGPDHISVSINGVPVGTVFGPDGSDCPEFGPDEAQLIVPIATFNSAVNGGDAVINMIASAEVDPQACDLATFISVDVQLFVPSAADADGNGVLDVCEVPACAADITGPSAAPDGNVDSLDFLLLIGQWASPCAGSCEADITGPSAAPDGNVDSLDFLLLIGQWGSPGCAAP